MSLRIGFGFDVHQLKKGLPFWIGGINIPHDKGGLGHSDADVLIHAICDALLGSLNLGDIGTNFPDTMSEYKDIDSKILLKKVYSLIVKNKYSIGNIDCTICLQEPKISPYIPEMKKAILTCINLNENALSIKATTTEKLGYVGNKEGVSAYAVALVEKIK